MKIWVVTHNGIIKICIYTLENRACSWLTRTSSVAVSNASIGYNWIDKISQKSPKLSQNTPPLKKNKTILKWKPSTLNISNSYWSNLATKDSFIIVSSSKDLIHNLQKFHIFIMIKILISIAWLSSPISEKYCSYWTKAKFSVRYGQF